MAMSLIEKEARKMLADGGQIDRREAEKLSQMILADRYVSRTERRFVKDILRRDACDDEAFHKFVDLLCAEHA